MRAICVILLSAALGACQSASTLPEEPDLSGGYVEHGIQLVLDRDTYRAGDPAEVSVVNGTDRRYGFNLCGRRFERRDGEAWVPMPPELRLCTAHLDALNGRATVVQHTDIASDLAPATYRMVLSLYRLEAGVHDTTRYTALSAPFRVQGR
jgi:hypothetical protein